MVQNFPDTGKALGSITSITPTHTHKRKRKVKEREKIKEKYELARKDSVLENR